MKNGDSIEDELKNLKNLKLPKEKISIPEKDQEQEQHDIEESEEEPEEIASEGDLTLDTEEDSD